jgi:hypothetical protein
MSLCRTERRTGASESHVAAGLARREASGGMPLRSMGMLLEFIATQATPCHPNRSFMT